MQINIAYVIITLAWICGVVANMSPCHGEDREFDPRQIRHGPIAQLVEQGTENPCVTGSIPVEGTICGSGSVVERHLAKVNVASSNLVFRSKDKRRQGVFYNMAP